jgi:Fic family protein
MNIEDFKSGIYKSGYKYQYFVPEKINHSFTWNDERINELLETASFKLGELNSFSNFVPDSDMFIIMHITKEAVNSSRIEGTQTNMDEALIEEESIAPERKNDWREVNNYVKAINKSIIELSKIPLSLRLIRNTHKILLTGVRGEHKEPGEFRRSQNWIGGAGLNDAVFIPPAVDELAELLNDFELFMHNYEIKIPHLIRIAILHYQFETMHPFLDGNGRIGRLLITLYLIANNILDTPLLYLSDFFARNKELYYDNLTNVRKKNDLRQWILFFLSGIIETANGSLNTLKKITALKSNKEKEVIFKLGKRSKQAIELFNELFKKPILNIKEIQNITNLSPRAASNLAKIFFDNKILIESTGKQRNRVFVFEEYLKMFQ